MLTPPSPSSISADSRTPWRCRVRVESGFTLIEVMVSALIVVLIASATATALIATAHVSGDQRWHSEADALATQDQERLRGMSDAQLGQLNGSGGTRTQTVGGTTFTINSAATYEDTTGGSSCTSGAAAYYKVTSKISWLEGFSGRTAHVTEESLLSRPLSGDLLARVNDQTGGPLSGVTITATGPSTQSATTDANGCVLFAGLTPGAYTVSTADTGYVDVNGSANSLSGTATVTSTGTANVSWNEAANLGPVSSVAASFGTAAGARGEADGISWFGSGSPLAMTQYRYATGTTPATTLTTQSLFPFDVSASAPASYTNNYTVWAGRCLQQQPPSTIADRFSVLPALLGQTATVPEPLLDLAVQYQPTSGAASAVKPSDVKLTFTSTAGASCSYSWFPTISPATVTNVPPTGWLANPGQPFASTATTGATASGASSATPEAGKLTICADYTLNGSTYYYGQLTNQQNTNFTATPSPTTVTITQTSTPTGKCP
jgi:prepilin-type N-terminal cleavage/methylation domain-containing protein